MNRGFDSCDRETPRAPNLPVVSGNGKAQRKMEEARKKREEEEKKKQEEERQKEEDKKRKEQEKRDKPSSRFHLW